MAEICILNGVNLNMLGVRQPEVYGASTLDELEVILKDGLVESGYELSFFQTNDESELIEYVHKCYEKKVAYIVINPGAWTHTSVALRDALLSVSIPFIEVHISNIFAREKFRNHSLLSDVASGVISGLGLYGYKLALDAAIECLERDTD